MTAWADEFLHSPVEVSAAVVTIAAGASAVFQSGRLFWLKLWVLLRCKPQVPRETLRMVQDTRSSHWSHGAISGEPATQICFDGHVTNISDRAAQVLRVEIPNPQTHATLALLSNMHDARRPQFLKPNETAEIRAVFFVQPAVAVDGKPWTATLIFIDQYGNRHKVKNCVFRATS